ncbi:MAG: DUF4153 domain-containing protein [Gammaproteobacteria bacterium]|nr:DUF4153 domain-containing protein [Gammaproteobacteria bacterium]
MLHKFQDFFSLLPVMKQVISRFPVAFIFILLLTIISLLLLHSVELFSKGIMAKLYLIMGFGTMAHVSFKLYVENKSCSLLKYGIGSLILTFIIIFYAVVLLDKAAFSSILFFSLALALSWMFAPYISRKSSENSVWYFNYQTGVALFFAAIAAVVFGGGLSLLLLSIGYLFEVKVPNILYGDIWIITWGILFTSYVLSNIAKTFDYEDESCAFPKGIGFIANYILVPLMVAYIAVLYAYFFKIILQWELPKGNLGWMISAFGIIGIATKLIAYPICHKGTKLMALFDRYFYYALILPVVMLFIAIFMRINEYGVTEQRYAVVLLGVLFSIVILAAIIKKDQFHIKHVPMLLAILVIVASYGPWSGAEISLKSQLKRFQSLLVKYDLIVDGQVVKSTQDITFEDRKAISSIADYLAKNKWRETQLMPLFETILSEQAVDKEDSKAVNSRNLLALINVKYVGKWQKKPKYDAEELFSYSNHQRLNNSMINVSGFDYIGRQNFYLYNKEKSSHNFLFIQNNKKKKIKSSITNSVLDISIDEKHHFKFDLNKHIRNMKKQGIETINKNNAEQLLLSQISTDGKVRIKIIIEQLNGKIINKNKVTCSNVKYILMLDFKN